MTKIVKPPQDRETPGSVVDVPCYGPMDHIQPALDGICSDKECDRPAGTRGMCNKHYLRWKKQFKRAGIPLPPASPRPKRPVASLTGASPHDQLYREQTRQRIRSYSRVDEATGCWIWQMAVDRDGYGVCQAKKRDSTHRVSYMAFIGPIATGLTIDHTCHTSDRSCPGGRGCPHRRCVNPDHLEAVTSGENTLRGRSVWAENARKSHCHRGHEFTPENTYQRHDGRACRACIRLATANYRKKKRASR
ncbi:hypothetical protein ACWDHW_08610 [Streptomyces melanosporofaciens]